MAKTYYFKDDEESKRYFDNENKMKENSQKWHETDDPDEKARLHFQNQVMSGENDLLDGGNRTFDENTGEWNVDYGNKAESNVQWKNEQNNKFISPYNDEIDALYDEIVNQKSFSYNPDTDPSYKAYENMYRREGDRASKSTLADVATAQGGVSSYAASAAQQAANAYAQGLTDKIPELEALAYQKYSADRNDKYNQLNSLMALDNNQYGRFIDERNFGYQLDRDKVNDEWLQKNFDNDNYWRGVSQENWQKTFDYNAGQDELDREWQKNQWGQQEYALHSSSGQDKLRMGLMPNSAELYALGLTEAEALDYLKKMYPEQYGNGGKSSNDSLGGKGGSGKKKSVNSLQVETANYPLTYEEYQIEQIIKLDIPDEEKKRRIDEIVNGG